MGFFQKALENTYVMFFITYVKRFSLFHHLLLNKYLNIFHIKHLLTWIYFGLWLVVVDIFWLSVGGGGWW